jgi:hypothetical protein
MNFTNRWRAFFEQLPKEFWNWTIHCLVTLTRKDGANAHKRYVREFEAGLRGRGWQADEPEKSLAIAVKNALSRKSHGIRVSDAQNWLFIDATTPLPGVCIELVKSIIEQDVDLAFDRFDSVILDFGGNVIVRKCRSATGP